jgi:hypothetical protein
VDDETCDCDLCNAHVRTVKEITSEIKEALKSALAARIVEAIAPDPEGTLDQRLKRPEAEADHDLANAFCCASYMAGDY